MLDVSVSMLAEDVNPIGWNAQDGDINLVRGLDEDRVGLVICRPGVLLPAVSHKLLKPSSCVY